MNAPDPIRGSTPEHRLRVAALDLVVTQTHRRQALSPVTSAVLCMALWPATDHKRIYTWLGVLALVSLWRHCFALGYLRASESERQQLHWEWHFFISLLVSASAWGLGACWVTPADSPALQALVYAFAIGMVGASAVFYGVHQLSARVAIPLIILPSTIQVLATPDRFHLALAGGGLIMLLGAGMGSNLLRYALRERIELAEKLHQQARSDALSGLANRRAFAEFGQWMVAHSTPAALLMIDIDHFKQINDRHGHQAGDRLIAAIGERLAASVVAGQCAARIGGEEFALLLPRTGAAQAGWLASQLLQQLAQLPVGNGQQRCTVSIGYAVATQATADDFDTLLRQADEALYAAKRGGRNRVCAHPGAEPDGSRPQAA